MIQLRYGPKNSEIDKIFNTQKIFQTFEREYKKNEIILRKKIAEYKQYLFSESEELKKSGGNILLTEEIVSAFRQDIKLEIVYWAIDLIFTKGKLDVEKNILHLIEDKKIIKKAILKERLLYVFETILQQNGISKAETYKDMLIAKFVEENNN